MRRPYLLVPPPLSPRVYFARAEKELPFPFGDDRCTLYSLARHALWHGVRALGLGDGDEILVPEYHCGTEIEALLKAGLELRWYELDRLLEPSEQALEALIGPETKALLLIHYLGFPQDVGRWRRWCDEHGLLLIEDAAPAWLAAVGGAPIGSAADLSIFSFRKTYGVPDGGALVCRARGPLIRPARGRGFGMLLRRNLAWAAMKPGISATALRVTASHRTYDALQDADSFFAVGDPNTPPLRISLKLLARLSDPSTATRRRDNYRYLLDRLGEHTTPPFDRLPDGASPYMFPLEVGGRDPLIMKLRHSGVHAVPQWPISHPSCPAEKFPNAERRRAETVGLPVHQELKQRNLEYIVAAVKENLEATETRRSADATRA